MSIIPNCYRQSSTLDWTVKSLIFLSVISDDCRVGTHGPPVFGALSLVPLPQPGASRSELVPFVHLEPASVGDVPPGLVAEDDSESDENED